MPRFDQTGPVGRGPMTGWKMGRCTNYGARRKEEVVEGSQTTEEPLQEIPGQGFRTRPAWLLFRGVPVCL